VLNLPPGPRRTGRTAIWARAFQHPRRDRNATAPIQEAAAQARRTGGRLVSARRRADRDRKRPAEAAVAPASGGTYTIVPGASGKCLDASSSSTSDQALLVQVDCSAGATHQQFTVTAQGSGFALINVNSGKCVQSPDATAGTQL
jgi:hypothetical protein